VTKPAAQQQFSGGAGVVRPGGRLQLYDGAMAGQEAAAVARVEVFFERPDRGNDRHPGKTELGSLFNPYWQARLAPITAAQRAAAQARQGGLLLP
jgi:hypothetical protein